MRLNQVTVPSTDVAESVRFYTKLGLVQIVSSGHYARFVCPDGDTTFSVHQSDSVCIGEAPVVYFESDDLDATVRDLAEAGIVFDSEPTDQPWLWREARLRDPWESDMPLQCRREQAESPLADPT
jgi:catechol 2,3-dioxygenase-like lactoylglutathione lyase family enzyme